MIKFTVTSTKGGVGKTTLTANLGALLADLGLRVLLVDADVQPSLSKYFPLAAQRPGAGLTEAIVRGEVTPACITPTLYRNLDIIVSDDPEGRLPHWLLNRIDRGFRLRFALQSPAVVDAYDCVLIDTQGAIGPLQDAAVLAADILVSPITPEILSAREFRDGTMELLERLEPGTALGATLAPLKAVIYRQDRTVDARMIACGIREDFIRLKGRVSVLETVVPHAKAYKEAATARMPVHRHERRREGVTPSAYTVMHMLAWELIPSLQGILVDELREDEGDGVSSADRDVSHEPVDQVTSTPRHVSVEERRRLVAAALDVRNPASRSRDLPDHSDPRVECPIEVSVDDIRPYEGNPRRTVNARFDEIKASIRASGIRSPLTVTRRPGDSHFIVEAGGNTRLEAIHQLWAETREPRFGRLTVLFRPWRSETHVLTAHLVENEQRGGMTFWDKACGVVALKAQLEAERGQGLSLRQLDETMRALGMPVNTATLAHYLFATERLRTLGEGIPDLTGLQVKTLQPLLNQLRRYAELQCGIDEDGFYASLLEPAFSQLVVRYRRRPEFSADLAMRAAEAAVARRLGIPVAEVKGAVSAMGRSTDTTAPSGSVTSALTDKPPAGARRTVDHAHEQASATVSTANGEAVSRSVPQHTSPSTAHSLASRSTTQLLRSRIDEVIAISGLGAQVRVTGDDRVDSAFEGLPGDGDAIASSGVRRHVRDLLSLVTGLVASCMAVEDGDAVPCVPELSDGGNGNALLRWLVTASDPAACASWEVLVAARDVFVAERQMTGRSAD